MNPFGFSSAMQRAMAGLINRKAGDNPKLDGPTLRGALTKGGTYVVRPSRLWPNRVVVTEVQSVGVDTEGDNLIITTSARGVRRKKWQTVSEDEVVELTTPQGMPL